MKFAEHLAAHITPEWRKQYIMYEVSTVFNGFSTCQKAWLDLTHHDLQKLRALVWTWTEHAWTVYEMRSIDGAHVRHFWSIDFPTPTQIALFTNDVSMFSYLQTISWRGGRRLNGNESVVKPFPGGVEHVLFPPGGEIGGHVFPHCLQTMSTYRF